MTHFPEKCRIGRVTWKQERLSGLKYIAELCCGKAIFRYAKLNEKTVIITVCVDHKPVLIDLTEKSKMERITPPITDEQMKGAIKFADEHLAEHEIKLEFKAGFLTPELPPDASCG